MMSNLDEESPEDQPVAEFPPSERVRILLAEHSSLRAEIVARTGHGYQVTGFFIASLSILATSVFSVRVFAYLFAVILIGITSGWFVLRDIGKAAARIREIEIDVNDRVGEDLLIWENLSGGAKTGFWGTAQRLLRGELKNADRPVRTFRGEPLV
jgi:hypothetical protein